MTLRPIFLSSLPRSGSTWAAHAIAAATRGRLIHEPFNWRNYPRRSVYHMRYLPASAYAPELAMIMIRNLKGMPLPGWRLRRPIVKDVHILLGLPYLMEWFDPLVVILVRHPCAVAQSWRRLGLEVDFRLDLLLSQETVYQRWLRPFAGHIRKRTDFYFSIGAYWGATHYILADLAKEYPDWLWVTHESLCMDTVEQFVKLLRRLPVSPNEIGQERLVAFLRQHDRQRNSAEGAYSLARVSSQQPDKWKRSMSSSQVDSVLSGVAPFGMLEKWETWNAM